jgi:hypothetical protein
MGIQERWEARQEGLAARGEAREAETAQLWNSRVERVESVVVEQARGAFERGDGWFEAEVEQRSVGSLDPYGGTGQDHGMPPLSRIKVGHPSVPHAARSDLLSRIEDEGWKLHTAQYVYVQLGEESRNKWFSSGQRVAVRGKIVGRYLFHRT